MKWNGIKNGEMLRLLKAHHFDCWIVVDKNIPYQQNVSKLSCLVIVLDVFRNTLAHISPLLPEILTTLEKVPDEKIVLIPEKT